MTRELSEEGIKFIQSNISQLGYAYCEKYMNKINVYGIILNVYEFLIYSKLVFTS